MTASRSEISEMPARKVRALVYELQVHQIELELQNEELRQAQVELAESRDRYSDLYEFAPIGYVTLDKKGCIVEANFAAAVLLGTERKHFIGTDIFHFVERESRDECYFHLQAVFDNGTKQVRELEMRKKDGGTLVVRLESIAEQFSLAQTHRCRTAMIDLTEARLARLQLQQLNEVLDQRVKLKTAELVSRTDQLLRKSDELERSERQFRALADNVPAMFSYIDRNQRHRYVNRMYQAFWHRRVSEIVGTTLAELLHPQSFKKLRPHIEAVLRGEESMNEAEIDAPDGSHTLEFRRMPDRDEKGDVQGFFLLATDITKRKQMEIDLDQNRKHLQVMSSELMLAEERERQRLAEDLHDSLGQSVFQAALKLNQRPFDDQVAGEIRSILEEVKKNVNTLTYELSPIVLRELGLMAALRWLSENLRQRYGLQVRIHGHDENFALEERVGLVLFRSIRESLINVAKHSKTDFASVSIRETNHQLKVDIKDRGKGFDLNDQSRHLVEGHFGLFSVRERLGYLGGTFKITSKPGKGTTVTLTAPRKSTGGHKVAV